MSYYRKGIYLCPYSKDDGSKCHFNCRLRMTLKEHIKKEHREEYKLERKLTKNKKCLK